MKDLSELPKDTTPAKERGSGEPPDTNPAFVRPLADAWYKQYTIKEGDGLAHAVPGSKFRASMAGSCTRKLAYYMEKTEPSDPTTVADAWRFELGHYIHAEFQRFLSDAFPGAEIELDIDYKSSVLELDGSAHADALVPVDDELAELHGIEPGRYLLELKSINGMGYKSAATSFRRSPPEGPRRNALLQGALSATAVDADFLTIVVLATENTSPKLAQAIGAGDEMGRFASQWTYSRDEFTPLAMMEAQRVRGVIDWLEADNPARDMERRVLERDVPATAVIVDPTSSTWQVREGGRITDTGKVWYGNYCDYCDYQTRCVMDG